MPSSSWQAQNELNVFLGEFCLIMLCLGIFLNLKDVLLYIMVSDFMFSWDFYVCANVCLCLYGSLL